MFASARLAMAWLHTWCGLFFGFILMLCFFFGALSVFDREIDRWAIPTTRFEAQPMPSFDKVLLPVYQQTLPDQHEYNALMPVYHDEKAGPMTERTALIPDEYWAYTTHRDPVLRMGIGFRVPFPADPAAHNHIHGNVTIDPRDGSVINDSQLKIGSDWFYPMHYNLNLEWKYVGYYLVGITAFFMLVALISGIWIHRKIFREFFTFRPERRVLRKTLDLHNLSGVAALPFHLFFALTGLIIFAAYFYLPLGSTLLKPLHDQYEVLEAAATGLPHERAGISAPLASVDAMVSEAKNRWAAREIPGEVGYLIIHHLGDINSYVSIYRAGSDRVALVGEGIHFSASTGEVLYEDPPRNAIENINEFLTGLHLQHFEHWLLRWLYVVGGLLGCVCIATGFIFFVEKRKQKHAAQHRQGARVVDALAVTTVTGMVIATLSMLIINKLLPAQLPNKGGWEINAFWIAWVLAAAHAFWCSAPTARAKTNPAWKQQCYTIAILAVIAVLANGFTTGDHLLKTVFTDTYWPVAGVDLSLLATAVIAALSARAIAKASKMEDSPTTKDESLVYG